MVTITAVKQIGAPPCPVGARIVAGPGGPVEGTLGCAEFDAAAVEAASEVFAADAPEPHTRVFHHDLGDIEVFVEPHVTPPLLAVVSATPVALELLRLAPGLGYRTLLVEPRTERVSAALRRAADEVGRRSMSPRSTGGPTSCSPITMPPTWRDRCRAAAVPRGFFGVMGSRRHVGPYVQTLRAMGFGEEDLARIRSPLGLDIGGT